MKVLTLATGNFDQINTFNVNVGADVVKASLLRDYEKQGDGIYWALNSGSLLKSTYTPADDEEAARLARSEPLVHGDLVLIEGERYTVRVKGRFSDCAVFDKA